MKKYNKRNNTFAAFLVDRRGVTGVFFGLAFLPLILVIGASIDFSRAATTKSRLQQAVDHAVIAAGVQSGEKRDSAAYTAFTSWAPTANGVTTSISTQVGADSFSATGTATVPMAFMRLVGLQSLTVRASGEASLVKTTGWGACIIALGKGLSSSDNAIQFDGSPNINLTGCTMHSNTSLTCNGGSVSADKSTAVGLASGCTNSESNAPAWTDIYNDRAVNISTICSSYPGVIWTAGTMPSGGAFRTVARSGYTEYHVCGDLTLKGGKLSSGSKATLLSDGAVIIIENGDLVINNDANVYAPKTTFVLAGSNSNSYTHRLDFPNGNGQSSKLTMEAPTDPLNPWHGMAIYVPSSLTSNVDMDFGPGSTLIYDGVFYMPNTNLTVRGVAGSSFAPCTSLVANTVKSNGAPNVALSQTGEGCLLAGVASRNYTRLLR